MLSAQEGRSIPNTTQRYERFRKMLIVMYQDEKECTDHEAQTLRPQEMLRKRKYFFAQGDISIHRE